MLALQSSFGNRAVSGWIARQEVPAPPLSLRLPRSYDEAVETATPPEAARIYKMLNGTPDSEGKVTVDFPHGCFLLAADDVTRLKPKAFARKEKIFQDFATARTPLFTAMTGAADDAARRTAISALSAFDQKYLPDFRTMRTNFGGTWDIKDDGGMKAVLAALQLEAATNATGDLLNDSDAVHDRVYGSAGMAANHDWCGFFTQDHYMTSNLDRDLRAGFFHTDNVQDYFQYVYARNPDRIKKWVWDDGKWTELKAYHEARGSVRKWTNYDATSVGGKLDIQPGDLALIDVGLDGTPNHIVLVQSYDPVTSTLFSIGGNDGGMVVDNAKDRKLPKESDADKANRERLEATSGRPMKKGPGGGHVGLSTHAVAALGKTRGAVFGIGRPSLADFEDHKYAGQPLDKPPVPLKEGK
jgi:hypothetical protein